MTRSRVKKKTRSRGRPGLIKWRPGIPAGTPRYATTRKHTPANLRESVPDTTARKLFSLWNVRPPFLATDRLRRSQERQGRRPERNSDTYLTMHQLDVWRTASL